MVSNCYNGPHGVMLVHGEEDSDIKRGVLGRMDTYNEYSMHGVHRDHC